jgi:hypothetical protein
MEIDTAQDTQKQTSLIIAILNMSKLERITTTNSVINNAFYKLKEEFPEYFNELLFSDNLGKPNSNQLESILDIFKLSGMLNWDGFHHYNLIKFKEDIKEFTGNLPEEKQLVIKKIVKRFDEYMQ